MIAAGAISSVAPTDHDLIVLMISGQTGLELWRTVIAGVHDSVFDRFSSVAIDSAGDVFAGGELFADSFRASAGTEATLPATSLRPGTSATNSRRRSSRVPRDHCCGGMTFLISRGVGGLAYSQSGGMCTWPEGGKFALVKIFGDKDADAFANDVDNCVSQPNPGQVDSDLDGFGNACDGDYNNDGSVGAPDFGLFRAAYMTSTGQAGYDPRIDANSDGGIGPSDFLIFKNLYLRAPGPSGLACAGVIPCP